MKSYLKFLFRNKLYTAIEAVGLVAGLCGCEKMTEIDLAGNLESSWQKEFPEGFQDAGLVIWRFTAGNEVTPAARYYVKECSKDKLVLQRIQVNVDGPNLIEGDVTFKKMGLYSDGSKCVQVSVGRG